MTSEKESHIISGYCKSVGRFSIFVQKCRLKAKFYKEPAREKKPPW
jgi:hypothetical protein